MSHALSRRIDAVLDLDPAARALEFDGRRFDCGSKLGFVEATLTLALERADMGADVRAMAERLLNA